MKFLWGPVRIPALALMAFMSGGSIFQPPAYAKPQDPGLVTIWDEVIKPIRIKHKHVEATLYGVRLNKKGDCQTRLQIKRHGQIMYDGSVSDPMFTDQFSDYSPFPCLWPGSSDETSFQIIDLDQDGKEEIFLRVSVCVTSAAYLYDNYRIYFQQSTTYKLWNQTWESRTFPRLEDINQDGKMEFIGVNEAFSPYVHKDYPLPIQIRTFQGHKLVDVTSQFPHLIEKDAQEWWENSFSGRSLPQFMLLAYLADQYLLGNQEQAWQQIQDHYPYPNKDFVLSSLKHILMLEGYIREQKSNYRLIQNISHYLGYDQFYSDLKWSANFEDGTIVVKDLRTGRIIQEIKDLLLNHNTKIIGLSPNHRFLAAQTQDQTVVIWDLRLNQRSQILNLKKDWRYLLMRINDLGDLLILDEGKDPASAKAEIWNANTGFRLYTSEALNQQISSEKSHFKLSLSSDGRFLTKVKYNKDAPHFAQIEVWDLLRNYLVQTFEINGFVSNHMISPDGSTLALGLSDYSVQVWDIASKTKLAQLPMPLNSRFFIGDKSPNSQNRLLLTGHSESGWKLWEISVQTTVAGLGQPLTQNPNPLTPAFKTVPE